LWNGLVASAILQAKACAVLVSIGAQWPRMSSLLSLPDVGFSFHIPTIVSQNCVVIFSSFLCMAIQETINGTGIAFFFSTWLVTGP